MADLKAHEIDECRTNFDVFDTDGSGKIDAYYLKCLIRAMNDAGGVPLAVTDALIEKNGATKKLGEKMLTFEEFLPIYSQVRKDKEVGTLADFQEGLKVYDKNENGTMMAGEMSHILLSLGERLTDAQVDEIFNDLKPAEDEDGYIKYEPFVKAIMDGPFKAGEEAK